VAACRLADSEQTETMDAFKFVIYPNPGIGEYTLVTPALDEHAVVSIYAMDGRLLNKLTIPANSENVKIDLTDKANGIYLVRFVSSNLSHEIRVIKQ
jgi:hypothetical protein